jgi:hypothetical protein
VSFVQKDARGNDVTLVFVFIRMQRSIAAFYQGCVQVVTNRFQEWLDEKLHWNISDYGGVSILHVDSHEIWVPEIAQAGQ